MGDELKLFHFTSPANATAILRDGFLENETPDGFGKVGAFVSDKAPWEPIADGLPPPEIAHQISEAMGGA